MALPFGWEYSCDGGGEASSVSNFNSADTTYNGMCILPSDGPAEVWVDVMANNAGDAIARSGSR
jgi:hypothetical protein